MSCRSMCNEIGKFPDGFENCYVKQGLGMEGRHLKGNKSFMKMWSRSKFLIIYVFSDKIEQIFIKNLWIPSAVDF